MTEKTTIEAAGKALATAGTNVTGQPAKYPSLASALIAFQREIPVPTKDSTNPHFNSSFASLDSITPLLTKKLTEVGIAWTATPDYHESGQYGVIGCLKHEGGDFIEGFFPVTATKPQDIGSAFTYARRYLLLSLTGVAPTGEDDDGQKAQQGIERQEQAQIAAAQAAAQADALQPLKARVAQLLLEKGDLIEGMDNEARGAKIKELGQAFFGRDGWANSDKALTKWIKALENPEADPQTGEVKE